MIPSAPSKPSAVGPKSTDTLAANLEALGPLNHVARAAIRAADDREIEIEIAEDGRLTGTWDGRRLASARRPAAETTRLVEEIDVAEQACIAIIGFGLGDHVEAFVRRLRGTGVVVVLETDAALLRAVFSRLDLSGWLADERLILRIDPDDSVGLAASLAGAHSLMMIGTRIVEHPPSRPRIGGRHRAVLPHARRSRRDRPHIDDHLARPERDDDREPVVESRPLRDAAPASRISPGSPGAGSAWWSARARVFVETCRCSPGRGFATDARSWRPRPRSARCSMRESRRTS